MARSLRFAMTYFFSASASTFLQAAVSLSLDLARQAMIRPPPGTVPLQYFSKSPMQASRCVAVSSCADAAGEVHSKAVIRMARSMGGFLLQLMVATTDPRHAAA